MQNIIWILFLHNLLLAANVCEYTVRYAVRLPHSVIIRTRLFHISKSTFPVCISASMAHHLHGLVCMSQALMIGSQRRQPLDAANSQPPCECIGSYKAQRRQPLDAANKRKRRQQESPEETAIRLSQAAANHRNRRQLESSEEAAKRRLQNAANTESIGSSEPRRDSH